jgi:hypothetical protein
MYHQLKLFISQHMFLRSTITSTTLSTIYRIMSTFIFVLPKIGYLRRVVFFTQGTGQLLTLIGPGEVKVDLADFDIKLRENLLSNLIFKKIPIPAKTSSESF